MSPRAALSALRLVLLVPLLLLQSAPRPAAAEPSADPLHLNRPTLAMPAVVVEKMIYVVGGFAMPRISGEIEKIDSTADTVETIRTKLTPRMWHSAEAKGPYIYVFGGQAANGLTNVVERYDTRDGAVTTLAPLPIPRHLPASVLVGDDIYVVGGTDKDGHGMGSVSVYNIVRNTWTEGAPMPTPRECSVAVCGQILYAVGGYNGHAPLATVEGYSLVLNRWARLPALPLPVSAHHVAAVGGRYIYTFGDYKREDLIFRGDMATGSWTMVPTPPNYIPTRNAAVVATADAIYVIGGDQDSNHPPLDAIQCIPLTR